jgi:hypothetical protein
VWGGLREVFLSLIHSLSLDFIHSPISTPLYLILMGGQCSEDTQTAMYPTRDN